MIPLPEAARTLAAVGWRVFPLLPREKIPLIPKSRGGRGVLDASADLARVDAWWRRRPDANIGLACGPSFWVLDVDGDEGCATMRKATGRFGRLPRTVTAVTGSGGWHFFFTPDPRVKNKVKVVAGLDTRSTGGYVVAAPSIHPCGQPYRWLRAPGTVELASAPPWLVGLVEPLPSEEPEGPPRPVRVADLDRYGRAALDKATERISAAPIGEQCETLDHEAFGIGRLVGGGIIPRDAASVELVAAGLAMRCQAGRAPWTLPTVSNRVRRALDAGSRDPRTPEARP